MIKKHRGRPEPQLLTAASALNIMVMVGSNAPHRRRTAAGLPRPRVDVTRRRVDFQMRNNLTDEQMDRLVEEEA